MQRAILRGHFFEPLHHPVEALPKRFELAIEHWSHPRSVAAGADLRKRAAHLSQRTQRAADRPEHQAEHHAEEKRHYRQREAKIAPGLGYLIVGVGLKRYGAGGAKCGREVEVSPQRRSRGDQAVKPVWRRILRGGRGGLRQYPTIGSPKGRSKVTVSSEVIDNEPQARCRVDSFLPIVDRVPGRMRANRQRGLHLCANFVQHMLCR